MLEHVYAWEAQPMLLEWRRVMKVGGALILELPCMDKVLDYIRRCLNDSIPVNLAFSWWAFWGNPVYRAEPMCHKWGYTMESLKQLVEASGFVQVAFARPRYHFAERDMRLTAIKGA